MIKKGGYVVLDVRSEEMYKNGHIHGSLHIPHDKIKERISELDPSKEIIVYCSKGLRSAEVSNLLSSNGYTVYNLVDGYEEFKLNIEGEEP